MVSSLPSRIMNYNVSQSSPTDELMTLGQIFSEIGDFASTILDSDHLSLSKKCCNRLNKIVKELVLRQKIDSAEDLYNIPEEELVINDLSCLSIGELHNLYRQWPRRHQARADAGRESHTFYYECKIVRELQSRKATNKGEQLKIDYCAMTYRNQLENLAFMFDLPINDDKDNVSPFNGSMDSPTELCVLIKKYSRFSDINSREHLVELVDIALDMIERTSDKSTLITLATEIAEIGRHGLITIPAWAYTSFAESIKSA